MPGTAVAMSAQGQASRAGHSETARKVVLAGWAVQGVVYLALTYLVLQTALGSSQQQATTTGALQKIAQTAPGQVTHRPRRRPAGLRPRTRPRGHHARGAADRGQGQGRRRRPRAPLRLAGGDGVQRRRPRGRLRRLRREQHPGAGIGVPAGAPGRPVHRRPGRPRPLRGVQGDRAGVPADAAHARHVALGTFRGRQARDDGVRHEGADPGADRLLLRAVGGDLRRRQGPRPRRCAARGRQQSWGQVVLVLVLVALGLLAYALFMFLEARYRDVGSSATGTA